MNEFFSLLQSNQNGILQISTQNIGELVEQLREVIVENEDNFNFLISLIQGFMIHEDQQIRKNVIFNLPGLI